MAIFISLPRRKKRMKKLFTKDVFFLASTILSVIGMLVLLITELVEGQEYLSYYLTIPVFPVCTAILYLSYRHHNKNVMKATIGALLMAMMMSDIVYVTVNDAFAPFFLTCDCLLFISHLLINSDRHASPARVRFSQGVVTAYFILEIVWTVYWLIRAATAFDYVFIFSSAIAYVSTASVVVCIESRLDAYRLDREAAGWTEETGYPEGYVHAYEKK